MQLSFTMKTLAQPNQIRTHDNVCVNNEIANVKKQAPRNKHQPILVELAPVDDPAGVTIAGPTRAGVQQGQLGHNINNRLHHWLSCPGQRRYRRQRERQHLCTRHTTHTQYDTLWAGTESCNMARQRTATGRALQPTVTTIGDRPPQNHSIKLRWWAATLSLLVCLFACWLVCLLDCFVCCRLCLHLLINCCCCCRSARSGRRRPAPAVGM